MSLIKKEMHRYRKAFYVAKNKKYLSESEINERKFFFNELKKSLILKKPHDNIDRVYYEDLDDYEDPDEYADDVNIEKLEALEYYLKGLIVIITNQ